MRLSSATIYNQSLNSMLAQESAYQDAAQEVSSGTRVVNPSDDSLAAAQAYDGEHRHDLAHAGAEELCEKIRDRGRGCGGLRHRHIEREGA